MPPTLPALHQLLLKKFLCFLQIYNLVFFSSNHIKGKQHHDHSWRRMTLMVLQPCVHPVRGAKIQCPTKKLEHAFFEGRMAAD